MVEKELNRCKDFLDYFGVKWDVDRIKLTSGGNSCIANPNSEFNDFLGHNTNILKIIYSSLFWFI